jgi:hypothetical protein
MKTDLLVVLVSAATLALWTGCGTSPNSSSTVPVASVSVDGSKYKLGAEPDGAVGVIAARESAEDGALLILVGRIGGAANPWIEGRAAFTLLDASLSVVAEEEKTEEGELCTGDCCATERLNCTTLVKVVDEQGQLVPVDSRQLLGVKESDLVVVQGTAQKDKHGNFVMLATGVYIRR